MRRAIKGLVAHLRGAARRRDARRLCDLRAVAARDDARLEPGGAQRFDERDDGRRLAGPADGHVAHDDHRHADIDALDPAEVEEGAARRGDGAENAGERRQRPRDGAALAPFAGEEILDRRLEIRHGPPLRGTLSGRKSDVA